MTHRERTPRQIVAASVATIILPLLAAACNSSTDPGAAALPAGFYRLEVRP